MAMHTENALPDGVHLMENVSMSSSMEELQDRVSKEEPWFVGEGLDRRDVFCFTGGTLLGVTSALATVKDKWGTEAPVGEWHGVTADERGRVTKIELGGNGLSGMPPASIVNLMKLTVLSLWSNKLEGMCSCITR